MYIRRSRNTDVLWFTESQQLLCLQNIFYLPHTTSRDSLTKAQQICFMHNKGKTRKAVVASGSSYLLDIQIHFSKMQI